ncbi:IucA/IucC family protein [Paenibacillus sp. SN-8-1]|uniref:IucA/IucC family protein n=1 Tax=Paenibacillus sp. SN-8-1 TaxID=3435409 RepID=UPI003D9A9002
MSMKQELMSNEILSQQLAEQSALTRLLNAYLREVHCTPVTEYDTELRLPLTGRCISLNFHQISAAGHHRYIFPLIGRDADGGKEVTTLEPCMAMDWLLEEVGASDTDTLTTQDRVADLRNQMNNSIYKTAFYVLNRLQNNKQRIGITSEYQNCNVLRSEQSLLFGHPFHPTPKSSEGFTEDDLRRYAPEMNASFQLTWFAVHSDLFREDWLTDSSLMTEWQGCEHRLQEEIVAIHRSSGLRADEIAVLTSYRLLPAHPWQSEYLLQQARIRSWIDGGKLKYLGSLGDWQYPSSSVRTVWSPAQSFYLKLPLHVRITNFIRTNNEEQYKRSMDAARIWAAIEPAFHYPGFGILQEHGVVSISDAELAEEFSVLFRASLPGNQSRNEDWHVVAAMLEDEFDRPEYLPATKIEAVKWIRAYVHIYVIPVFQLFADFGYSLEAHVQNTLIRIQDGVPTGCYVRDLEGVSVCRNKAQELGWVNHKIAPDSPVLSDTDEAWKRLLYYNVTNHLSHMVATISRASHTEEGDLWSETAHAISTHPESGAPSLREWINRLLETPVLPAKANLISRFHQQGERPRYVEIPNPLNGFLDKKENK